MWNEIPIVLAAWSPARMWVSGVLVFLIGLAAITANYRTYRRLVGPASVAGVVKADAYGLGAARVAPALATVGCDSFFVARLEEGVRLRGLVPDARIFVEPFVTAHCIHSTPNATANATLQLIAAALAGDGRAVNGQVRLCGEAHGVTGVCGIPLTLNRQGWLPALPCWLDDTARGAIAACAASIDTFLGPFRIA